MKFTSLGLNTIRVYTVDNTADHDECMNALADAGIYLALDVNTPKYSINRAEPEVSYNKVYLQNVFATIDKFSGYKNLCCSSRATRSSMTMPQPLVLLSSRLPRAT